MLHLPALVTGKIIIALIGLLVVASPLPRIYMPPQNDFVEVIEMTAPVIYTDTLGMPEPKATISVYGSKYGAPGTGYFALSSISNCPYKRWPYLSYDVSHIVAEMEADGWDCEVSKDGYNAPLIKCTHKATKAHLEALKQQSNNKFAAAEKGYIRFGDLPNNGLSLNHRDKIYEKGVSVFEAEFVGNDYRVLLTPVLEASYLAVMDRPAYRVYGEIVGYGADGEPVLKVAKTIKLKR